MPIPAPSLEACDLLCAGGPLTAHGETARVPGDKSISHRALLLGAFTPGVTRIAGLNRGSAVEALFTPLERLGVRLEEADGQLRVSPAGPARSGPPPELDVGPSSAAARLLIGALAGLGIPAVVTGDATLRRRPMDWLVDPLRELGARIDDLGEPGRLPVAVSGGPIRPGLSVRLRVGSAQARSGVLLAAVHAGAPVTVHHPVRSRDHTERLLAYAGARFEEGDRRVSYLGGELQPVPFLEIPGDPSLAAYPAAACLLAGRGARVEIEGVCLNPTRTGFFDVLARAGAAIRYEAVEERCGEPVGRIVVEGGLDGVRPVEVADAFTLHALIDEVPLLFAVAARLPGRSIVHGAGELAFKETDRLHTTRDMLRAFGAAVEVSGDALTVDGGGLLQAGRAPSFGDHRVAMAAAALASSLPGTTRVEGGSCAATSFPGFTDLMNRIGCRLRLDPRRS